MEIAIIIVLAVALVINIAFLFSINSHMAYVVGQMLRFDSKQDKLDSLVLRKFDHIQNYILENQHQLDILVTPIEEQIAEIVKRMYKEVNKED